MFDRNPIVETILGITNLLRQAVKMSNSDISTTCLFTFEFPVLYLSGTFVGIPHRTSIKTAWNVLAALNLKLTG